MASAERQKLISNIKLKLGGGMIDIELDPEHFDYAVDTALDRYRQRSDNAIEESMLFLDLQPHVQVYTLPQEVQEIRCIYRRGIGGMGGGAAVDPFSLANFNSIYMMGNPGGLGQNGGAGTLATFDFASQHQELIGRMFGRDMLFTWDPSQRRLTIHRNVAGIEQVMLHAFNIRPETVLINDPYAKPWLRDYATAVCKEMIGQARSKFQSLAGPQGGVSLNGDALKAEAKEDFDRLEEEIKQLIDSHSGYGFCIG